jgi:hypothetical protein
MTACAGRKNRYHREYGVWLCKHCSSQRWNLITFARKDSELDSVARVPRSPWVLFQRISETAAVRWRRASHRAIFVFDSIMPTDNKSKTRGGGCQSNQVQPPDAGRAGKRWMLLEKSAEGSGGVRVWMDAATLPTPGGYAKGWEGGAGGTALWPRPG